MGANNAPFANDILTIWGYKLGVMKVFYVIPPFTKPRLLARFVWKIV